MNNNLKPIDLIPPFKRFCMTIGELPSSYLESMTYYEMLVWFTKFLGETVIPAINNNGEAVSELQTKYIELKSYVDNYFDNLDVQEEINNKLDDMAESGQLTDIIAQYLGLAGMITFDTVSDMQEATNLVNGSKCTTLGYYDVNDGGSAIYKIRTITNNDVVDNMFIIELNDNTLVAELIIENELNVKQIGAKNDDSTDNGTILRNMFTRCRELNITNIFFPKGIYRISQTLLDYGINGLVLKGENDDIYNSTILMRTADVTIFNFGGVMTLSGITPRADDLILENLTFRDLEDSYINNVYATLNYTQHFTIQNCSISCRNKALDLKHCYDSRFINTDFTAGGNSNDPMITIHGGKHASPTAIGWDSANCISFIGCRFERYSGTAIKTTNETQPGEYNPDYDPAVAVNVNTLWFDMCRFEAPTLLSGVHLDFNYTQGIRLNSQLTILDGQSNLKAINFDNCGGVFGEAYITYNRSTVGGATEFNNFSTPAIVMNNCNKFNFTLMVGNVYSTYQLDYFIDLTANDNTRRTMNLNLIYSQANKKLYNLGASNQNISTWKQGKQISYGYNENGYGIKFDNTVNNMYSNNMTYDSVNSRYGFDNKYTTSNNTNRTLDSIVSDDTYSYHRFDYPIVMNNALMITPSKYPSSVMTIFRSSGTTTRAIMYASAAPSEAQTNVLFKAGDIIFNTLPTAGGNVGWVCTTSGNPGTWKSFGSIAS